MRYDENGIHVGKIDHESDAIAKLPPLFKRAFFDKWRALLLSWVLSLQDVENAALTYFSKRNLFDAFGVHLDRWGRIVGESRDAESNDLFRKRIAIRILVNNSRGNYSSLYQITKAVVESARFRIWGYLSHIGVYCFSAPVYSRRPLVLEWYRRAKPATKALTIYTAHTANPLIVGSTRSLQSENGVLESGHIVIFNASTLMSVYR